MGTDEHNRPAIPYPGAWSVTGSDRSFDWIGPDSTIPPAGGFVFMMFDRLFPFTKLITFIRRFFGRNSDDISGPQDLIVAECGAYIVARGVRCDRLGNTYIGEVNVGGTIHRFSYDVVSPTELRELVEFEIPLNASTIPVEAATNAAAAGIDLMAFGDMQMEHDETSWVFAGRPDPKWQAYCAKRLKISDTPLDEPSC